jgi:hypothetical protein
LDAKTKLSENQRGFRLSDAVVTFNRANDGSEKILMFLLPDTGQIYRQLAVELIGIEPTTSGLQSPRSPS